MRDARLGFVSCQRTSSTSPVHTVFGDSSTLHWLVHPARTNLQPFLCGGAPCRPTSELICVKSRPIAAVPVHLERPKCKGQIGSTPDVCGRKWDAAECEGSG